MEKKRNPASLSMLVSGSELLQSLQLFLQSISKGIKPEEIGVLGDGNAEYLERELRRIVVCGPLMSWAGESGIGFGFTAAVADGQKLSIVADSIEGFLQAFQQQLEEVLQNILPDEYYVRVYY